MKKEKSLVKKEVILFSLILSVCLLSIISISATSSITAPVQYGNYTKSITMTISLDSNSNRMNMTNASCYFNATGTNIERNITHVIDLVNTTIKNLTLMGSGTISTESISAGLGNLSCRIYNGSDYNTTISVENVTIDGTAPTVSISTDQSRNYQTKNIGLNWSCSDALSRNQTTAVTLTAQGDAGCIIAGTTSWSTPTGSQLLHLTQTQCAGKYTNTITCTDFSGNIGTTTSNFNIYYPEGGSATIDLGQNQNQQTVQTPSGKKIPVTILVILAMIILIIVAIACFFIISQSKKRR